MLNNVRAYKFIWFYHDSIEVEVEVEVEIEVEVERSEDSIAVLCVFLTVL